MAGKAQTLTCTFFVNGRPVDKLTDKQLDAMAARLSDTMSLYYSHNMEEFSRLNSKGGLVDVKNK